MSKTRELHEKAMEFCDEAFFAKRNGDLASAKEFSRKALSLEIRAAETLKTDLEKEPSRSILYKSAAILAIECGKNSEALRLIKKALKGTPTAETKQELQNLLKKAILKINRLHQRAAVRLPVKLSRIRRHTRLKTNATSEKRIISIKTKNQSQRADKEEKSVSVQK